MYIDFNFIVATYAYKFDGRNFRGQSKSSGFIFEDLLSTLVFCMLCDCFNFLKILFSWMTSYLRRQRKLRPLKICLYRIVEALL